jgi:hypothetical protein
MNLKDLCDQIIKDGKAATKRPWKEKTVSYYDQTLNVVMQDPCLKTNSFIFESASGPIAKDRRYIVNAANHCDKLARICLVMNHALKQSNLYLKVSSGTKYPLIEDTIDFALKKAEEILNETKDAERDGK